REPTRKPSTGRAKPSRTWRTDRCSGSNRSRRPLRSSRNWVSRFDTRASPVDRRRMNSSDRELGLHRSITRRDFLNGVSLTVAGAMLAPELLRAAAQEFAPESASDYYPPTRVGMRGDHPGSFEVA